MDRRATFLRALSPSTAVAASVPASGRIPFVRDRRAGRVATLTSDQHHEAVQEH